MSTTLKSLSALYRRQGKVEAADALDECCSRMRKPVSIVIMYFRYKSSLARTKLSVLQPSNYSKYHMCLQILVGAPSATALLQHGIPFLRPLKIARPYIVSSAT